MSLIQLKIVSRNKLLFFEKAKQVTIPTISGVITILPNHVPLITIIKKGKIKIIDKKENEQEFEINSGTLDIREGSEVVALVVEK